MYFFLYLHFLVCQSASDSVLLYSQCMEHTEFHGLWDKAILWYHLVWHSASTAIISPSEEPKGGWVPAGLLQLAALKSGSGRLKRPHPARWCRGQEYHQLHGHMKSSLCYCFVSNNRFLIYFSRCPINLVKHLNRAWEFRWGDASSSAARSSLMPPPFIQLSEILITSTFSSTNVKRLHLLSTDKGCCAGTPVFNSAADVFLAIWHSNSAGIFDE